MKRNNLQTVLILVLVLSVGSFTILGCSDESPSSSGTSSDSKDAQSTSSNKSAAGPLAGKWVVDLEATAAYHGPFSAFTPAEKAAYEAARFEFTGSKFKYSLREKSGEVGYKVKSVTKQAFILEMPGGIRPTLTFIVRQDGRMVLPQDGRWDMLVLKKK